MILRPPRSTRTYTLLPYTTLVRAPGTPGTSAKNAPVVRHQRVGVAGTTGFEAAVELQIGDAVDGVEDLQHGKAAAIAAVARVRRAGIGDPLFQRIDMARRAVADMDIVARPGSAGRAVMGAFDGDGGVLP